MACSVSANYLVHQRAQGLLQQISKPVQQHNSCYQYVFLHIIGATITHYTTVFHNDFNTSSTVIATYNGSIYKSTKLR